jgi:hypothetical protein
MDVMSTELLKQYISAPASEARGEEPSSRIRVKAATDAMARSKEYQMSCARAALPPNT